MSFNVKSMPSTRLVTSAGRFESVQPGPRAAARMARKVNGPMGQGLPTGHAHGPLKVVVRREGKVLAALDLSRASGLKLGR